MTDLGIDLTKEDLDVMMEEADINKDGRIDYAGEALHRRWLICRSSQALMRACGLNA